LAADTGRNYLSKMYNDDWLNEHHLTYTAQPQQSVGDLLRTRGPRQMVAISPNQTAESAIHLMEKAGISQLPVLENGKPVGCIQEMTLARVLHDNADPHSVSVAEIMAKPLPALDATTHLDEAYRLLLAGNTGVLAMQDGRVVDIITRIDLVQYWGQLKGTEGGTHAVIRDLCNTDREGHSSSY